MKESEKHNCNDPPCSFLWLFFIPESAYSHLSREPFYTKYVFFNRKLGYYCQQKKETRSLHIFDVFARPFLKQQDQELTALIGLQPTKALLAARQTGTPDPAYTQPAGPVGPLIIEQSGAVLYSDFVTILRLASLLYINH